MAGIFMKKATGQKKSNILKQELLDQKISDLELQIPGTRLEGLVNKLYHELENSGIAFKPKTYLSDEWGCPHGVPVIGIPFYLADPELYKLEGKLTGIEAENIAETLMYLRHEAGHALNYAYRLYKQKEWIDIFGKYSRPYREVYPTAPFSPRFVRHIAGWYAQKHPDDDFAETFAVWLTPGSNWQKVYAETPALKKLSYVDRVIKLLQGKSPPIKSTKMDRPVQELNITLDTWYESNQKGEHIRPNLHPIIGADLRRLFPAARGRKANGVLLENKAMLIREVNRWTGLDRHLLTSLFDELLVKIESLSLKIEVKQKHASLIGAAIFLATLATNFQICGHFMED
jgi:hypothetical protein